MANVIEGIQQQCKRVREVLIPAYESIGPVGTFGKMMLNQAVNEGEAAIASGDVVRMLAAYKSLEGCE
jgi:hypothetical protein